MMGMIYMATNTVNGKRYIGQTKMTLEARRHVHHTKSNVSPFGLAIKKYGKSAFTWEILHNGILDPEELDRLEYEEIKNRNTISPHGYNIREGGNGTSIGVIGANARRAQKVICVETGVVYQSTKEAGRKVNNRNSNIINVLSNPFRTCAGYHWRYADDAKHKEISEGYIREREQKTRAKEKAIQDRPRVSTWNAEWHDAVRKRNEEKKKKSAEIAEEIKRIGKSEYYKRYGLKWLNDPDSFNRWKQNQRLTGPRIPKPIRCIETGIVYESISQASKMLGIDHRNISKAAMGKKRIAGGFRWEIAS